METDKSDKENNRPFVSNPGQTPDWESNWATDRASVEVRGPDILNIKIHSGFHCD
jgi:hypothetical protein